ncbi:MAG: BON domain-containing protein [bacterium]
MHIKRGSLIVLILLISFLTYGCEALLIGAAATAGYKIGTDQKTISESMNDSMITASIKTRLLQDPYVRALSIDVDTNLGEVTLSGYVRSQEEIDRAITLARGVNGVKDLKSFLKVRSVK